MSAISKNLLLVLHIEVQPIPTWYLRDTYVIPLKSSKTFLIKFIFRNMDCVWFHFLLVQFCSSPHFSFSRFLLFLWLCITFHILYVRTYFTLISFRLDIDTSTYVPMLLSYIAIDNIKKCDFNFSQPFTSFCLFVAFFVIFFFTYAFSYSVTFLISHIHKVRRWVLMSSKLSHTLP